MRTRDRFAFEFGNVPLEPTYINLKCPEYMFYLYLPVKLANQESIELPDNLKWLDVVFDKIDYDNDDYIYVTVKNQLFQKGGTYNREGFHADGYGTDDINYIWYDKHPTIIALGNFSIDKDFDTLNQFDYQAENKEKFSFPPKFLIKLDQTIIHSPPKVKQNGERVFIKISVSKHKYNLKGNSINYNLDYEWDMQDRISGRNYEHISIDKE